MKKFFLTLTGAAVLAGSMAVMAPEPAMARHWHSHKQVCRVVVKKRVVWRHGHRHVVRYKVRHCWWRR
jgi:Spy/CpxP family protein refolding chaperone